MRTIAVTLIVLSLGVSGAMVGMSGFGDVWGADPPQTTGAQEQLEETGDEFNPNEDGSVSGPVSSGESDVVGLIVDGVTSLTNAAASVALLPITLINLGFPAWFALPVGSLAYVIAGVGIIEFAGNRQWT